MARLPLHDERGEGLALDVFGDEPLGAEHPFWTLPNVLLTPHVSGTSDRYMMRAMEVFLQNLSRLTKYGQLVTPVDVAAGY
jgi:D-2-hydroxyacid dehydrogenase (NADP+)